MNCLLEDREGNLWLGSNVSGLMRLRRPLVTMLNAPAAWLNTSSGPIIEDQQGAIWIGTQSRLVRFWEGVLTAYLPPDLRPWKTAGFQIGALHQTRAGALWAASVNLHRYQDGKFHEYPAPGNEGYSALLEDQQGRLWVGTTKGLGRFADGQMTYLTQRDGLVHDNITTLYADSHGALWIGTIAGVSCYAQGHFTNYTARDGLTGNVVRDIYEDRAGAIWFCTYGGGLNRLWQGRITAVTTKQGLQENFLSRLLADEQDNFWLLGNLGIMRVNRQALNEVANGQRSKVFCAVYNHADGMQPNEGNGGHQPAGVRARDGRLWFSTIRGVAVLDPRLLDFTPPPVQIERLVLDGVERDPRQPLTIQPGQNNLEIHYTGLSLGKPELVQFSYQLSDQQENWLEVGTRRTAYFSQLQPGTYRFNVKALSPDGVWSVQPASLNIVVKPRFWQTWWFRLLVLAGLGGLVVLAYRQRIAWYQRQAARQENFTRELINSQERDRQRIASELHDGLGQSLVIIKRRALQSLETRDDHVTMVEQMQEIVEATTAALDEMREVVFALRPQQLDRLGLNGAV